jgi:hypothetical protein
MTSPLLAVPASSSLVSPAPSPADSHATAASSATFGPGSRSNPAMSNAGPNAKRGGHDNAPSYRRGGGGGGGLSPATSHQSNITHLTPTSDVKVIDGPGGRILCVADVRGEYLASNST